MNVETGVGRGPGLTRIYLARHGRTSLNAAGVLRGRLDPALDDVGRRQAAWLGAALGDKGVRVVVTSPLRRALQTAQAVASCAGIELETDPRLIDRDYGAWAGKSIEVVEARWGSMDGAPGVEPAAEVQARAWEALVDIERRAHGAAAVVVSHDVVNRLVLVAFDPRLGDPARLPQETGCFNTLDYRDGRWTVLSVNAVPGSPDRPTVDDDPGWEPTTVTHERGSNGHGG